MVQHAVMYDRYANNRLSCRYFTMKFFNDDARVVSVLHADDDKWEDRCRRREMTKRKKLAVVCFVAFVDAAILLEIRANLSKL